MQHRKVIKKLLLIIIILRTTNVGINRKYKKYHREEALGRSAAFILPQCVP